MKASWWNKMPLWGRVLAILIGFPVIVALVRVLLEQWVSHLTAGVLVLVVLIVASVIQYWKRKSPEILPPMSKEEVLHEQREAGKLSFFLFAFMTLVFWVGTIIGFYGVVATDPASYSWELRWLVRVAMGIIGLISLLLSFVTFAQARYEFLRLAWHRGQRPPPREFSISYKAAFWIFAIIAAVVVAIAKLNRQ